jgi:hypothetical protein
MIDFRCQRRLTQGTCGQGGRPPPLATPMHGDRDAKCVCAGQVRCCFALWSEHGPRFAVQTTRKPTVDSIMTAVPLKPSKRRRVRAGAMTASPAATQRMPATPMLRKRRVRAPRTRPVPPPQSPEQFGLPSALAIVWPMTSATRLTGGGSDPPRGDPLL